MVVGLRLLSGDRDFKRLFERYRRVGLIDRWEFFERPQLTGGIH